MSRVSVALGVFDGVHLGHRAMLDAAVAAARGGEVVAVTFDPHPLAVVTGEAPLLLCTMEERHALLLAAGASRVEVLPFSKELAVLPPAAFHEQWLVERLQSDSVVVGDNFRFGHRAAGDVVTLRELSGAAGIDTVIVPLELAGGEPVSSTRIRRLLLDEGDVTSAARLLGRRFQLTGPVVLGAQRGRTLGMRTANLGLASTLAIPLDGVYAGIATVDGLGDFDAAVSIGTNPQFHEVGDAPARSVEAHLLEYEGPDFYGATCSVRFVRRLRGQAVFADVDALVAQMRQDLDATRHALAADRRDSARSTVS